MQRYLHLLTCAALGSHDALAALIASPQDLAEAPDHALWSRLAAVRTALLPPDARSTDLALTIARRMVAAHDPSCAVTLACALADWMQRNHAAEDAVWRTVTQVLRHAPHVAAAALAQAMSAQGERMALHDDDVRAWMGSAARAALLDAATNDARAAWCALAALLPIAGALTTEQRDQLVRMVMPDPEACADLIIALRASPNASHGMHADRAIQHAALQQVMRSSHAAARTLRALIAIDGALTADHVERMTMAIARDPSASANLIAAIAPHWTRLSPRAQDAAITAAARDPWSAQKALIALLSHTDAVPITQVQRMVMAVERNPLASGATIERIAAHWRRLPASLQRRLLQATSSDPWAACQALTSLLPMDGAVAAGHVQWLARCIARDPDASVTFVECIAPHWNRLNARLQRMLMRAAAHSPRVARWALSALSLLGPSHAGWRPHDARTAARVRALIMVVARDGSASADLIAACAPQWARLDPEWRDALIAAAARCPRTARQALAALAPLVPIPPNAPGACDPGERERARTMAHVQTLATTVARDPHASAALIAALAPCWAQLDVAIQNRLLQIAAHHPTVARQALESLTLMASALTTEQTHALLRAAFPHAAWDAFDHMPRQRHAAISMLFQAMLASALRAPAAPMDHAALRRAWMALDASDHVTIARALAHDNDLVIAWTLIAADLDAPLDAHVQRIVARTIIPAVDALAALSHGTEGTHLIASWIPDEPMDDIERAAWQDALQNGRLPMHVVAAVAPRLERTRSAVRTPGAARHAHADGHADGMEAAHGCQSP